MMRRGRTVEKPSELPEAEFGAFLNRHSGDFFAIPLGTEFGFGFGFGRLKRSIYLACYDLLSPKILSLDEIEKASVLFAVPFDINVIVTDRWKTLGNRPLRGQVAEPTLTFIGDPVSGPGSIYEDGKKRPYAGEDMSKVERSAIWSASSVEERLRNHFTGRPDPRVELYRYKTEEPVLEKYEGGPRWCVDALTGRVFEDKGDGQWTFVGRRRTKE